MLKNLYIHNYAIIDELNNDFSPQMNVITGETGAGKSILMGALSLILGERADTSVLLNREKKCIVEGNFIAEKSVVLKTLLSEHDLEDGGADDIVIRREIAVNGKSRAFVNDTPVNLAFFSSFSVSCCFFRIRFPRTPRNTQPSSSAISLMLSEISLTTSELMAATGTGFFSSSGFTAFAVLDTICGLISFCKISR